jgi:hypothetical protein
VKAQNGIIIYQFLLSPLNDLQMFKPRYHPELSGYENSNLLTGFFIGVLKRDTD